MIRRALGRTGQSVGVIGLGLEHLENASTGTIVEVVREAMDGGVDYFDLFMATPHIRDAMGEAVRGRRDRVHIAGHLGPVLSDGKTDRSRDPAAAGAAFDDLLHRLGTDYIDVLMLFFVDEPEDFDLTFSPGGLADRAVELKRRGTARAIGMSTHSVDAARRAIRTGLIDVLMFPVNPAFDLLPGNLRVEALWQERSYRHDADTRAVSGADRRDLYAECARRGVAIVAMKPFAAGWLLDAGNPSGVVLTPVQYLHYALSQPAVAVTVPGCRTVEHVRECLGYLTATEGERDYAAVSSSDLWKIEGRCMYCNHCLPCPVGIDVAAITRLADVARSGATDELRRAYMAIEPGADTCTSCGVCVERCPFGIDVPAAMREAVTLLA